MYGIDFAPDGITVQRPKYRYVLFGGAIRGAKTLALFLLFSILGFRYPGSRWTIVRKDLEVIKRNTVPSWEKFASTYDPKHRIFAPLNRGNWSIDFYNGSKLLFMGENIDKDPELLRFDGNESNGYGIEEARETRKRLFDKLLLRAGSWILPSGDQPPSLVALTSNPGPGWVKELFYDPHAQGIQQEPFGYIFSSPSDNPFLPDDYRQRLEDTRKTSPLYYARYVEGDWNVRDGDMFKSEMFTIKEIADISHYKMAFFGDIAYTKKKNSDECAFLLAGINAMGAKHGEDCKLQRMNEHESIDYILRKLVELQERFQRKIVAKIEANSSYFVALRQEMQMRNLDFEVIPLEHNGEIKFDRIKNTRGSLYRWTFSERCRPIINQLIDISPDMFDTMLVDGADVFGYADRELTFMAGEASDMPEYKPALGTLQYDVQQHLKNIKRGARLR